MEGEKAASVNEELHFRSASVDFEASLAFWKGGKVEMKASLFLFRNILKENEQSVRGRSLTANRDTLRFTDLTDYFYLLLWNMQRTEAKWNNVW